MSFRVENEPTTLQGEIAKLPTAEFLSYMDEAAALVVVSEHYHDPETGYISDVAWKSLVDGGILLPVLQQREADSRHQEIMEMARIFSYHDLHLGLTYGIVAALGVIPLQRFAHSPAQREKLLDIARRGERIGLAITEWHKSGSTALEMDSSYEIDEDGQTATLNISKHLQGLSGNAGLTIVLDKKGSARKTVGLFFVPQELIDTQLTEMAGLHGLAYGINTGTIELNLEEHLLTELPRERLDEFQDVFIKSRFLFIGMTLGHQERMEAEANEYAGTRIIDGGLQKDDLVVARALSQIRAHRLVSRAMANLVARFRDSDGLSVLDGDTRHMVVEANIIKALSTEYAADAAAIRAELKGGAAFYEGGALQDYVDIWPFLIFEGSRLLLNSQTGRLFLGPLKVDRKIIAPGFSDAKAYDNFLDYFAKVTAHRELFNGEVAIGHLDELSTRLLTMIAPENLSKDLKAVIGEIVARLFALGCVNREEYDTADYQLIKATINLEISQLALKFFSLKGQPVSL